VVRLLPLTVSFSVTRRTGCWPSIHSRKLMTLSPSVCSCRPRMPRTLGDRALIASEARMEPSYSVVWAPSIVCVPAWRTSVAAASICCWFAKSLLCMVWISLPKLAAAGPESEDRFSFVHLADRPGSLKYTSVPVRIILMSVVPPCATMCMSSLISTDGLRWYCSVPLWVPDCEPVIFTFIVVTAVLTCCAAVAASSSAWWAVGVPAAPVPADPVPADPVLADAVLSAVAPVLVWALLAEPLPPEEHAASRARAAADRPMTAGRREEPGIEVTQKRYKVCGRLAGQ